jgi:murein DD-endopeptidase MepM/ murein hydrolase activator NlpD
VSEVLYVNKRLSTDKNKNKGARGFYAALGISAVMIGSACFFAYGQNGKPDNKSSAPHDAVVDRKSDDIPKATGYRYTITTAPPTTTAVITTRAPQPAVKVTEPATVPAADLKIASPPVKEAAPVTEPTTQVAPVNSNTLENPNLPLADISNIIEPFSNGELIRNETTGAWQTHNGTDIKAEVGAEVYAVSSGEITKIENDALWGVTVTLDHHNGYVTKYCGLGTDLSVQQGDTVAGGQTIGTVGNTADIESNKEPHLHIEMTHNKKFIDPLSILK